MNTTDKRLDKLATVWPKPIPEIPEWAMRAARRVTGATGPAPAAAVVAYAESLLRDELTPRSVGHLTDADLAEIAAELAPELRATVADVLEEVRGLAGRLPG